jgi:hypothetical protein
MMSGREFTAEDWSIYEGVYMPGDLSKLPGLWKAPLEFGFPNLMLIDFSMDDVIYWLMPILEAIELNTAFRRIVLRDCESCDEYAIPFPFHAFDSHLDHCPAVKVLLAWAEGDEDPFPKVWRARLPLLEAAGRIQVLYSDDPHGT